MSREKQIEEMSNEIREAVNGCSSYWSGLIAEHLYEQGYRKQSKWISVEERLPEIEGDARTWGELKIRKSVRVLCACVQKSGKTFVKEGYCEVWGERAYWRIPGSIDKVTHWMPLPEAPKGGAE